VTGVGRAPLGAVASPEVRVVWIILAVLVVIGLGAWSTTFKGQRPIPTGETLPPTTGTTVPVGDTQVTVTP
jgi:hypothetical protein